MANMRRKIISEQIEVQEIFIDYSFYFQGKMMMRRAGPGGVAIPY